MWFIYGYLIDNAFVQIPNGLASIIAGVQLSLFLFFPSKRNLEVFIETWIAANLCKQEQNFYIFFWN